MNNNILNPAVVMVGYHMTRLKEHISFSCQIFKYAFEIGRFLDVF